MEVIVPNFAPKEHGIKVNQVGISICMSGSNYIKARI